MKKIIFYETNDKESVLIKLIEKFYIQNKRVIIFCHNNDEVLYYEKILWTRSFFLPHGSYNTFEDSSEHPIWLSTSFKNENNAQIAFNLSIETVLLPFENIINISGKNLLEHLGFYKNKGYDIQYWRKEKQGWNDCTHGINHKNDCS